MQYSKIMVFIRGHNSAIVNGAVANDNLTMYVRLIKREKGTKSLTKRRTAKDKNSFKIPGTQSWRNLTSCFRIQVFIPLERMSKTVVMESTGLRLTATTTILQVCSKVADVAAPLSIHVPTTNLVDKGLS